MIRQPISKLLAYSLLGFASASASATDREWSTDVSGCQAGTVKIWVTYPGSSPIPFEVPVLAHPNDGAGKASEIARFLRGTPPDHLGPLSGFNPTASGSTLSLTCDARISLRFDVGTTAETDGLKCPNAQSGQAGFDGFFNPFTLSNQPAIFTAGIVTDVGELSATVSAQELNFQTDGPIICQALFQRLAPRAPQYGAQINYAGDRLEVYFDPAYTVTQGGVIFGTTSPSAGSYGLVIPTVPPPCPGDVNGDGVVDLSDLAIALSNYGATNATPAMGDLNGDGVVDLSDLVDLLGHYGTPCP